MKIKNKILFNPEGNDDLVERKLFNGNSTNVINLNSIKYKWCLNLYDQMLDNFWRPQKINLTSDILDWDKLTKDEQNAYYNIISFLIFLDSIQTQNIGRFSNRSTSPELTMVFSTHQLQEAIHVESYQIINESVIPVDKRNSIYSNWKTNKLLFKRAKFISEIFENIENDNSDISFFTSLIANYLLEGLFFSSGFLFFYSLSSRHLMSGTADMIALINRDERTHVILFERIINEFLKNEINNKEHIISYLFKESVKQEIEWSENLLSNILGFNKESIEKYTKHRANYLLKKINIKPMFPKETENPFYFLECMADIKGDGNKKANFFEVKPTAYNLDVLDFNEI